jgi:DNA-binding beta-propeller fold protein YncE
MKFLNLFCIICWILAWSGCRDNPIIPPDISTQHYYLYAGNWGYDQVYVIDTDSNTVVDTLRGFGSVHDLAITHSGKKLYVSNRLGPVNYPGILYSVNLSTGDRKEIVQKATLVHISPDGLPIAIVSTPYDSLRQIGIIDTSTDEISYIDTLDLLDHDSNYGSFAFSPILPVFYSLTNQGQLFAYDYIQKRVVKYYRSPAMLNMCISRDGGLLFFANGPVVDLVHDSVVGWIPAYNSSVLGTVTLSIDGSKLYLTDPAKYWLPEPVASGRLKIFDASTFINRGYIDIHEASGEGLPLTDRIVVMPDGKTAYVTASVVGVFVLDLKKDIVIKTINFEPRNIWLRSLVVGAKY